MEGLLIALGVLLLIALVAAPLWQITLLYRLQKQLDEQRNGHQNVLFVLMRDIRALRGAAEITTHAPAPAAEPRPAPPHPVPPPTAAVAPPTLPIAQPIAQAPAEPVIAAVPAPPTLPNLAPRPPEPTPQPAPQPVPQPLPVDTVAGRILRETWNWLIVGESYRRPGISAEVAIATNWLVRVGVLVLLFGIGFFLKYSIDRGLLGPQARVAMSFVSGAAMTAGGVQLFGKRYSLLGQGLAGAGIATLYFAVFAATDLFRLIPLSAGFALMAFVTLTAGVLAVRHHTILLAILGTLGGYLTPLVLNPASTPDHWLYGYLLLLAAGVTGVAWRQRWPALTYMSFVCHNALFLHAVHWNACATTLPFLCAWFVLFTTAIVVPALGPDRPVSALEPIGLLLVAAVFLCSGYELVRPACGKAVAAWIPLGMAAYYTAHVHLFLRRGAKDRAFVAVFLGLAAGALILTLPLLLSRAWLTMSWSVLALVALWIALKLRSPLLRALAMALQGVVAAKLCGVDLLLAGIQCRVRALRVPGLVLFAIVVAKVFLVDLCHLAAIYRIAAFVVLGIVLLLAAFAYLRPEKPVQEAR